MPKSGRTGPERAAASRQLPAIPNEIFLEIFGYIQPSIEMKPAECTQILSQLSLVCSLFCTMLRPRLFSKLELNGCDKRANPPSVAFCHAILRGDTHARLLAGHVRTCEISSWSSRDSAESNAWVGAVFITMYRSALRWVPSIEVLSLSYSRFDSGMWEVVGRCSKLKFLRLFRVFSQDDVPVKEVEHLTRLRLSNFSILYSQAPALSQILNPSALLKFIGGPKSLNTFLAGGYTSKLETLIISRPIQVRSLMNILSRVPSVHSLTIFSCIGGKHEVTFQEFSALLPNLRSLACPLPLAMLLAPGRPLTTVGILDAESAPPLNLDTILGSHEPSTTIVELSIPPTIADETPAAGRFPCLRKLVLRYIHRPQIPAPEAAAELKSLIVSSCNKWAGNSSVQELSIPIEPDIFMKSPPLDLPLQHAVLTESLSQIFPALLHFQLGTCAIWERFAVGDTWRVFVDAKDRADLVARLEAGDPDVVDYDGCLRRLCARNLP